MLVVIMTIYNIRKIPHKICWGNVSDYSWIRFKFQGETFVCAASSSLIAVMHTLYLLFDFPNISTSCQFSFSASSLTLVKLTLAVSLEYTGTLFVIASVKNTTNFFSCENSRWHFMIAIITMINFFIFFLILPAIRGTSYLWLEEEFAAKISLKLLGPFQELYHTSVTELL